MPPGQPLALVMGDLDLVRPFVLAGVPCAVFTHPTDPARSSRRVDSFLPWADHWTAPEEAVSVLREFAGRQSSPPVLFPETDPDLLLVSRHRSLLQGDTRFLLADAELIEAVVDKARFSDLAENRALPVPMARKVRPSQEEPDLALPYPLIIKPLTRSPAWRRVEPEGKARHVADGEELRRLWPILAENDLRVLVQEAIAGDERQIESYHAYVDATGSVAADFTGRKVRTYPAQYGFSTAVTLTDAADVAALGRDVLERLGLVGPVKMDFKRDPRGRLHLLEINPRFSLWHHLAARAGMNLPAYSYAELTGAARPRLSKVRAGATWCEPLHDARAVLAQGDSLLAWMGWAVRCDAYSALSLDDPLPFVWGVAARAARNRIRRAASGRG